MHFSTLYDYEFILPALIAFVFVVVVVIDIQYTLEFQLKPTGLCNALSDFVAILKKYIPAKFIIYKQNNKMLWFQLVL